MAFRVSARLCVREPRLCAQLCARESPLGPVSASVAPVHRLSTSAAAIPRWHCCSRTCVLPILCGAAPLFRWPANGSAPPSPPVALQEGKQRSTHTQHTPGARHVRGGATRGGGRELGAAPLWCGGADEGQWGSGDPAPPASPPVFHALSSPPHHSPGDDPVASPGVRSLAQPQASFATLLLTAETDLTRIDFAAASDTQHVAKGVTNTNAHMMGERDRGRKSSVVAEPVALTVLCLHRCGCLLSVVTADQKIRPQRSVCTAGAGG